MCQGSFNGLSRKIPRSFKEVTRVFQESFKGIFLENVRGVLRKIEEYVKEIQREFQVSLKCVSRLILGSFKVVPIKFIGSFKENTRVLQDQMVFQG